MSQPHEVRVSAGAERDLLRLPEKIGGACLAFIFGLAEQPHRLGRYLRGQLAGLYSSRRGSYQIVYRIDNDTQRLDIAHRGLVRDTTVILIRVRSRSCRIGSGWHIRATAHRTAPATPLTRPCPW